MISTDFSHYPTYKDAVEVDKLSGDAVVTNSPNELIKALEINEAKKVRNLSTSMCGWTSVLTLMYMTEDAREDLKYKQIQYMNFGEAGYKDTSRVVGYWAMSVMEKNGGG